MTGTQKRPRAGKNVPKQTARREYDEREKLAAVTACLALGGLTEDGLAAARRITNSDMLSMSTLARWRLELQDKVQATKSDIVVKPQERAIVEGTHNKIVEGLQKFAQNLIDSLSTMEGDAMQAVSMRDRAVSFGIAYDKLERIANIDPRMNDMINAFKEECRRTRRDPYGMMQVIIDELRLEPTPPADAIERRA